MQNQSKTQKHINNETMMDNETLWGRREHMKTETGFCFIQFFENGSGA